MRCVAARANSLAGWLAGSLAVVPPLPFPTTHPATHHLPISTFQDLWGAGCVFFEITSLYPLFPGTNELDQINRIHKVLGTPTPDLLAKFKRNGAAHVNFDFPDQKGIGLSQLIPHAAPECVDLMQKMLAYDAAERMSAREGLQHAYFRDVRELEARRQQQGGGASEDAGGASNASTSKSGRSTKRSESMEASGGGGAAGAQKALPNISPGMDAGGNPTKAPAQAAVTQPQGKSGASKAVVSRPSKQPSHPTYMSPTARPLRSTIEKGHHASTDPTTQPFTHAPMHPRIHAPTHPRTHAPVLTRPHPPVAEIEQRVHVKELWRWRRGLARARELRFVLERTERRGRGEPPSDWGDGR